jgi:amino acid transporter
MSKETAFRKRLSLLDLTFLGLGSIIGSGWLYASQRGANYAGSNAWIAWVGGAVAVLLIGLVYAELGAALPRAGGFVRYPEYTHGSLVGFMTGFASLLAYSSVAGIEVEAVRGYAQHWWPALGNSAGGPTGLGIFLQLALLLIFFLLNYWSVNIFGKTNTLITFLKFVVPTVTVIVLLTQLKTVNFSIGGASPGGAHGVFQAIASGGIVFAFLGFRQAVDFGAEAKNPQRDIPRAIILAVTLGAVVYVLLQVAFLGAVPHDIASKGWGAVQFKSPFVGLATSLGISWLSTVLLIDAVISPAGTGNIYLSGTARSIFAWAKNGHFYSWFAKVDPESGVPRAALWLTFIMAALWTMPVQFKTWNGLVGAVTSATVMTYMIGPISMASLRRTMPNLHRPFVLKGAAVFSPLAFIAATWIIYWSGWQTDSLLIAMTVASLILYFAFMDRDQAHRERVKAEWKSGIWLIVYYVFIYIMSRLGSFGPGGDHALIKGPYLDSGIVAIGAIIIYYWGVASSLREPSFASDDETDAEVLTTEA